MDLRQSTIPFAAKDRFKDHARHSLLVERKKAYAYLGEVTINFVLRMAWFVECLISWNSSNKKASTRSM